MFTLGSSFKIQAQILRLLFPSIASYAAILTKKWAGLQFGRFFSTKSSDHPGDNPTKSKYPP
jgi:hypothetical protein